MAIRDFQLALKARGFDPGAIDDTWGPATERAAMAALAAVATPEIDPQLVADLKRDEGLRLDAYPDPLSGGDPWTIGYGHTGPEVKRGLRITMAQAEEWLVQDIVKHNAELDKHLPWWRSLSPNRQRVLANMVFNLGWTKLSGFKNTLRAMQEGRYGDAADGMMASLWAKQVGARAQRLTLLMRNG